MLTPRSIRSLNLAVAFGLLCACVFTWRALEVLAKPAPQSMKCWTEIVNPEPKCCNHLMVPLPCVDTPSQTCDGVTPCCAVAIGDGDDTDVAVNAAQGWTFASFDFGQIQGCEYYPKKCDGTTCSQENYTVEAFCHSDILLPTKQACGIP